ncbi:MAG: hypothetical protein ACFFBE_09660 [Promethearchaeota archaeon]
MRKHSFCIIIWILLVNISITSSLFIVSYGAAEEIEPEFGDAPIIDGIIDDSTNEWEDAFKNPEVWLADLPIALWVMQTKRELFISVQLDLQSGYHNTTEFFGLLISANSSENLEDFVDAKFIQFTNITSNEFSYLDFYINNSKFLNDTNYNGDGAAKLEGDVSIYEFSIPIEQTNTTGDIEDSILEYDNNYAFNITYGVNPSYPQGIKKSVIVLIKINSPSEKKIIITDLVLFVFSIIIYSSIGVLFGLYIYKIVKLKEKIERLRS